MGNKNNKLKLINNKKTKINKTQRIDSSDLIDDLLLFFVKMDKGGKITQVNKHLLSLLGKSKKQIIGKKFISLLLKHDNEAVKKIKKTIKQDMNPFTVSIKIIKSKNIFMWTEWTISSKKNREGDFVAYHAIGNNITERKEIESQLEKSENRFRTLLQNISEAITVLELNGNITYESPQVSKMFGYKPGFLVGKNAFDFIHPDDVEIVKSTFNEVADNVNLGNPTEFRFKKADNSYCYIETFGKNLLLDENIKGIIITSRETSEKRLIEKAINQSIKKFQLIWEKSNDGMRLTDKNGILLEVNEAYCQLVNKSKEELIGKKFTIVHSEVERESSLSRYKKRFHPPFINRQFERLVTLWNKKEIWLDISESFFEISEDEVLMLTILRNITQRKETEDEVLLKSEELNKFFEVSIDLMCIADIFGYFRRLNPEWVKTLGYEIDELIGKQFFDYIHPEDIQKTAEVLQDLKDQKPIIHFANRYRCKDGSYKWIEWRSYPAGNLIYASARDITERRKIEEELKLSSERQEMVIKYLPLVHYTTSAEKNLRTTWISEKVKVLTGYKPEEFYSSLHFWDERVHPEDRVKAEIYYDELFRQGFSEIEYRWKCADGEYKWFYDKIVLIRDEKNEPKIGIGMFVDISEKKKSEKELIESEQRYKTYIHQTTEGISRMELEIPFSVSLPEREQCSLFLKHAYLAECNLSFAKMYGAESQDELIGKRLSDFWVGSYDEKVESLLPWVRNAFTLKDEITTEKNKFGQTIYLLNNTLGVIEDNKLLRVWGTQYDITNQKTIEDSLKKSEAKFRTVIEQSTDGFVLIDERGKIIEVNNTYLQIIKKEKNDILEKYYWDILFESIPKEKQTAEKYNSIKDKILSALITGKSELFEKPIHAEFIDQSGNKFFFQQRVFPIKTDAGLRLVSITTNITDRYKYEQALEESEKRFRELSDLLPQTVFEVDLEGKLTFANKIAFTAFGYTNEDFNNGVSAFNMVIPEQREMARKNFNKSLNGEVYPKEYTALRKDGTTFPVFLTANPIVKENKTVGLRGTIFDISHTKIQEYQLEESKNRYKAIVEAFDGLIYICSSDYKIEFMNQKLIDRTGYDATGEYCFKALHNLDAVCSWCVNDRVKKGEIVKWEVLSPKDRRWYYVVNVPIKKKNGTISKQAMITDITERKKAELIQATIFDISQAVAESTELNDLYALIHSSLLKIIPCKNIYLALYDDKEDVISFPYWIDEYDKVPSPRKAAGGLTEYIIRTGKPLLAHPELIKEMIEQGMIDDIGAPSIDWLGTPLIIGKKTIGALVTQSYNPQIRFSDEDKDVLLYVSGQIARTIENKRKEIELRDSENKFRAVITESIDGFSLVDENCIIIEWNKALENITKIKREDAVGAYPWDLMYDLSLPEMRTQTNYQFLKDSIQSIIKNGASELLDQPKIIKLIRKDNSIAAIREIPFIIKTEKGFRLATAYSDITEQLKLETELKLKAEQKIKFQSLLLELSKNEEKDFNSYLNFLLESLAKVFGVERVSFWYLNETQTELVLENLYDLKTNKHSTGISLQADDFPVYFKILRTKGVVNSSDARNDEQTYEFTENYFKSLNIFSLLDAPVWREGKIIGVVCFEKTDEIKRWTLEEEDFAKSVAQDVTRAILFSERQKAISEVIKLSRAIAQSPASVVITNLKGEIEYINPKFTQITGYELEEVIGVNPRILKSGEMPPENYLQLWDTILSGKEWVGEFHNKKKNGELFWESAVISPVKNENNEVTHFIAIKEDITHKKELEFQLKKALDKAEEASKLKSTLLANMSHELRTPMNGIIGFSNILKEELSDSIQKEMVEKILKSSGRLLTTLNSILNLSELESGSTFISPIELNPSTYAPYYLIGYEKQARDKGLEFLIELKDKNIFTFADESLFKTIIINLVDNAIKFTETGRIEIEIGSQKIKNNLYAFVKVKDTGIGISKENHELIFEEFKQLSEGFMRKYEGSGLGLNVARKMARLMKGEILLESNLGLGSIFTLILPGHRQTNYVAELEANLIDREIQQTNIKENEFKILLVEDNTQNQEVIEIFLRNVCSVDITEDGSKAIDLCKKMKYDAILMDINLGIGLDGISAIHTIRKIPEYFNIPIIAITGYVLSGDRQKFLDEGFDDYLPKPFNRNELLQIVNKHLNKD